MCVVANELNVLNCAALQGPMNISWPARTIECFRCNWIGHLQAQCRDKPNKVLKTIHCSKCDGFSHIERLCQRTAILVAELATMSINSVTKTSKELSELEILMVENEQLRDQIAELLQGKLSGSVVLCVAVELYMQRCAWKDLDLKMFSVH